jgi:hypothetical protein
VRKESEGGKVKVGKREKESEGKKVRKESERRKVKEGK